MTIGQRIKAKRLEKGYTQGQLATMIGSTTATINKYETGAITNIPYEKFVNLAKAVGVTPAYLMGWETEFRIEKEEDSDKLDAIIDTLRQHPGMIPMVYDYIEFVKKQRLDIENPS